MRLNTLVGLVVLALLAGPVAAMPLEARDDRALRSKGVVCTADEDAGMPEATHSCWFTPSRFGSRDYSVRMSRDMQVITELGPKCGEIEILADEAYAREGEAEPSLRRVRVKCSG